MRIYTNLSVAEYRIFKGKADQLGISEYALAKDCILIVINQPKDLIKTKTYLIKTMEWLAKDIKETPKNLL
jgi:hypothetical protein